MEQNLRNNRILVMTAILFLGLLVLIVPVAADISWYSVSSSPNGATVCIDGWDCEHTSAVFEEEANTWHTVTVSQPGYETYSDYLNVGPAGTNRLIVAYLVRDTPAVGWVSINPFGADYWVDGDFHGDVGSTFPLAPGTYTLLQKEAGY